MHALTRDHYPMPDHVNRIFSEADKVVFEIDMTRLEPTEMAAITRELGRYDPPATLLTELSPETLDALGAYLDARGATLEQVAGVKPWLLGLQISVGEVQRLGFNPVLGLDMHFLNRAVGEGKDIGQLETFREQMTLLAADPPSVQDLSLRLMLQELDQLEAELNRMVQAWESGDTEGLYAIAVESADEYPALAGQIDRIIHDRNRTMAEGIRALLAEGRDVLVIVGALHLGGDEGILALLADEFDIRRVNKP